MTSQDVATNQSATDIPESVRAALNQWVRQAAEEAGAPARDALAQSTAELDALKADLAGMTAARDEALALAAQRGEDIDQLSAELRNARTIATDALVGKAKDQLAIEGKDAQLVDLRAQLERNVTEAAALSDRRLAAEMELVGATTARDNYAAEIKELRDRLARQSGRAAA